MIKANYKLTLLPMVMMIFSTVYGFANGPRAFYMMGYGAIFWYVLAALAYFLPYAVMMVEFGYTFRTEHGGVYSWINGSVNTRFAFMIAFMWYTAFVIYLVILSNVIWVPVAKVLELINFNNGLTPLIDNLHNNTALIGVLAILLVIVTTIALASGLRSLGWVASISGFCVIMLNILLIVGGLVVLVLNKFHFAEPIVGIQNFILNPHKSNNILSLVGFAVFAVFAYGGLEVVSGLVDKVENPEKTFPRGLILTALIISVGYSVMIFIIGIFTNWLGVMDQPDVNLGNVLYIVMGELGAQLGVAVGMDQEHALQLSKFFAGISGLSMVLIYIAAYFACFYSPLKQVIEGTPKELWPSFMLKRKNDMPVAAIIMQGIIIIVIIAFNAFGGIGAKEFMNRLVMMGNVALTLPYVFIAIGYYAFRKNTQIQKPFLLLRDDSKAMLMAIVAVVFVGFANLFTIFEPLLTALKAGSQEEISTAVSHVLVMTSGPIVFAILGYVLYQVSLKKR